LKYVGRPVAPIEDFVLVKGEGLYVDDVRAGDVLCLGVVRSPYAHARIKSLDFYDAIRRGAFVILPRDLELSFRVKSLPAVGYDGARIVGLPPLASGKVNFVGQPVVGVVAGDRYSTEDLAELVTVDYEPLEPVVDPMKAVSGDAPVIHEEIGTNVCLSKVLRGGNVEEAFSSADVVVEDELKVHRVIPNPMEPRGIIVSYDGNRFTVWVSSQGVHRLKRSLCETLGIPESSIRVVQSEVGGAFGTKSPVYPEYVLALYAAMVLKRPVKWIETRRENILATHHGRDVYAKISLAAKRDGKVLGVRASIMVDLGAYNFFINTAIGPFIAQQITGPYDIGAAEVEVRSVFTNKTPLGPYRGAGRPEAAFLHERMMDLLAEELGMDPLDLRARNLVKLDKMPYTTPLGLTLDREDYVSILEKARKHFRYDEVKQMVSSEREKGRRVGMGAALFLDLNRAVLGESALVRLSKDGKIHLVTGSASQGQGLRTIYAQLAADELGVEIGDIVFISPDSDAMWDGVGTFGSRSAVIGGAAVIQAAKMLKNKILERAAEFLGSNPEELEIVDGMVKNKTDASRHVSLKRLAEIFEDNLEAYLFQKGDDIFSFGVHMALVEVDVESGTVKVLRYETVDDVGVAINPLIVETQIAGGVMQGIAQLFYEEAPYGQDGQLLVGSIGDAGVPSSVESAEIRSLIVEYPSNYPHGARGVGEAGTIGALPTLARAVENAVGKRVRTTSLKPENIWVLSNVVFGRQT